MSFLGKIVIASVSLMLSQSAFAVPIRISHIGTGSGELGGTSFTNVSFSINAFGDTNDRVSFDTGFSSGYFIDHLSASIGISGLGPDQAVFTVGTRTFVNNTGQIVGFSLAGISGGDLFNGPGNGVFSSWDMLSSIGFIIGNDGLLTSWGSGVSTNRGLLRFDSEVTPARFIAIVDTTSVPEPATIALLVLGFAGLGWVRKHNTIILKQK